MSRNMLSFLIDLASAAVMAAMIATGPDPPLRAAAREQQPQAPLSWVVFAVVDQPIGVSTAVSQASGAVADIEIDWRPLIAAEGRLNMTFLALNISRYVNGVAKKHAEVSRLMFATHAIDSITNGVRAATWVSPPFAEFFDRHIPDWRKDNFSLRYAHNAPRAEAWAAHQHDRAVRPARASHTPRLLSGPRTVH